MYNQSDFLSLILDEGQRTCFASAPNGTALKDFPGADDMFFCINALNTLEDMEPSESYHAKYRPRRADCNVVCYRNFLIELDKVPLTDQIAYVKSRIPVSSIVYSGSKSYHFIISLETPLASLEDYLSVSNRLQEHVPLADKACKNPSRLSRLPFRIRQETNRAQSLLLLNGRINNKELLGTLPELKDNSYLSKHTASDSYGYKNIMLNEVLLKPDLAINRLKLSGRNQLFFWLYNRFNEYNMSADKRNSFVQMTYDNLENKSGFTLKEALLAARIKC